MSDFHPSLSPTNQVDTVTVDRASYTELVAERDLLRHALSVQVRLASEWSANMLGTAQLHRRRWNKLADIASIALEDADTTRKGPQ